MTLLRILGLGILLGCSAAGFVWFFWGLTENLLAMGSAPVTPPAEESEPSEDEAAETA